MLSWPSCSPRWRGAAGSGAFGSAGSYWALVGVATALDLIYDELFRLDEICLWCTSVHVISLLLFVLTAFGTAATAPFPVEPAEEPEPQTDPPPRVPAEVDPAQADPENSTDRPLFRRKM